MKRFVPMLTLAVVVLMVLMAPGTPTTAWAQDGHGAEGASAPAGANWGALIAFSGVLAILVVGSVYMAWSEPEADEDE